MAEPTKTSRREFLQGRAAVEALGDAVIGSPEPLPPPAGECAGQSYLLNISREAMACQFEILLPMDQRGPPAASDAKRGPLAPREDIRSAQPDYRAEVPL